MKIKELIIIFFLGFGLIFVPSCKNKKTEITPEIASSDEALFNLGEKYLKKDPEKARLYLRQLIDSFPKSFYAQRAKLAIADSFFKKGDEGNLILAASEYREFISLYPFSPSAPYAQYQIAMTYFKKKLKPGRDQTKTIEALNEFKKVINNYPLSEEAKDSRNKIKECEESLAEHTFSIGEYYYKAKAYKAAVNRLTEILTNYPEYAKMESVYFLLGDSYYRWGKSEEGIPYFRKLISDYPRTKLAREAQEILEEIEKQEKDKK